MSRAAFVALLLLGNILHAGGTGQPPYISSPAAICLNPAPAEEADLLPWENGDAVRPAQDMHAFPISAGNGGGNLFVVMKAKPIPGTESMLEAQGHPLDIYIYQNDGEIRLIQQVQTTANYDYFQSVQLADVDFDGDMDFYWPSSKGNASYSGVYWIWDEGSRQFISDPYHLDRLSHPSFDAERRLIRSDYVINWQAGATDYWKYEDGNLICIRSICAHYPDEPAGTQTLSVTDWINGQSVEVYHAEYAEEDGTMEEEFANLMKWHNLNYHGEKDRRIKWRKRIVLS